MSSLCTGCGELIPANSDFCGECGAQKSKAGGQPKPAAKPASVPASAPASSSTAPITTKITCNGCDARIPSTAKFCPECGGDPSAIKKADVFASGDSCSKCNAKVPPSAKFCPECGTKPGPVEGKQPAGVSATGHTCKGCGKGFDQGVYVTALNGKWHSACFACGDCKTPIKATSFTVKNGLPLCDGCVEKAKQASSSQGGHLNTTSESTLKCTGCEKPILSKYVKPDGKPFHSECFVCTAGCGTNLMAGYVEKEGKYMCSGCASKSQSTAVAPAPAATRSTPKSNVTPGSLTCIKCFSTFPPTAEKCPSCGKEPTSQQKAKAAAAGGGAKKKFCGECGAQQTGDGAFCGECGKKL
eukprot:gb/GEZN01009032.1/.p1 GENE.gb/GEZN01009032.1/~~gb/GEZN01009032.1/.p1  ORF type:complete len:356 (-),score=51.03 gb/GEZN01009032.1/:216-1283(-)